MKRILTFLNLGRSQAAPDELNHRKQLLFQFGFEYYLAGRWAALCGTGSIAANLLHHGLEMMMKGVLIEQIGIRETKKLGHKLTRCWKKVKALVPVNDLSNWDKTVKDCDKFEEIRYPDRIVQQGGFIGVRVGGKKATLVDYQAQPKQYDVDLNEIDQLVQKLFEIGRRNPKVFTLHLRPGALEILTCDNPCAALWM